MTRQAIAAQSLFGEYIWVDWDYDVSKLGGYDHSDHDVGQKIFDAIGLRQEYEIWTDSAVFGRHASLEDAEAELASRRIILAATLNPTDYDTNPRIVTRWATSWEAL